MSAENEALAELDRRGFLKVGAGIVGTVATATVGTTATGTVAADDDDGFEFDPWAPRVASYFYSMASSPFDGLLTSDDLQAGQIALYREARQAWNNWSEVSVRFIDNHLNDAQMVASIYARDAIASAWESGKEPAEAHTDAREAITEYFAGREQNTLEAKQANGLQVAWCAEVARDTDDLDDNFISFIVPENDYDGDGTIDPDSSQIEPVERDEHEVEYELVDGETVTTTSPRFVAEWDDGDSWTGYVDDELIDNFDETESVVRSPESGAFVLESDDGHEFATRLITNVHSVARSDDDDLPSIDVTDYGEMAAKLKEIRDMEEETRDNYTEDFVQSLYDALDDGTITPEQIRSPEGYAELMSGSTDATESRYQMALAMQLGMKQPDLGEASHFEISYTGYTGLEAVVTEDYRRLHPVEREDGYEGTGMLYSEGQTHSFVNGESYATNPIIYALDYWDDDLHAYDSELGSELWSVEVEPDDFNAVYSSPHSERLYITSGAVGIVACIDETTGEEIWRVEDLELNEQAMVETRDGERAIARDGGDGDLVEVDPENGETSHITTFDDRISRVLQYAPTGAILVGDYSGTVTRLDPDDYGTVWEGDVNGPVEDMGIHPTGRFVAVSTDDEEISRFDLESGEKTELVAEAGHTPRALAAGRGTIVYQHRDGDATCIGLDPETGEEKWSYQPGGSTEGDGHIWPCGRRYVGKDGDQNYFILDVDNGQVIAEPEPPEGRRSHLHVPKTREPALGTVINPTFFDAADGETFQMRQGTMTVEEMKDSDGETVTPWTSRDELADEIDDLCEDVYDEIDELDDADDIETWSDLELVADACDAIDDPDDLDSVEAIDWGRPEYDEVDLEEYAAFLEDVHEDYVDALENHGDTEVTVSGGIPGMPSMPSWERIVAGVLLVGGVLVAIVGVSNASGD